MDEQFDDGFLVDTLRALFELSRGGRPGAGALSRALASSPTEVARALLELDRRGLVDATRVRLTFRGLARAAAIQRLQSDRGSRTLVRGAHPTGWKATSSASISERPTPSSQWPTRSASESYRPTGAIG